MEIEIVEGNRQFWGKCGASHCNQRGLCGVIILCREGGDAAYPKLLWDFLFVLVLVRLLHGKLTAATLVLLWKLIRENEEKNGGTVSHRGMKAIRKMRHDRPSCDTGTLNTRWWIASTFYCTRSREKQKNKKNNWTQQVYRPSDGRNETYAGRVQCCPWLVTLSISGLHLFVAGYSM